MKKIMVLMGVVAAAVSAYSQTYTSGIITDDTFLALAGPPSAEVYGMNIGGQSNITANGYVFSDDRYYAGIDGSTPPPAIYASNTIAIVTGFLTAAGSTSGDAGLDAVLDSGQVPGPSPSYLLLGGLTQGVTYNLLMIECDTRTNVGNRTFTITDNGMLSPAQAYAFLGGAGGVGGYIMETFVASGTTEIVANNQPNGAQLNGFLLATAGGSVVPTNPPPSLSILKNANGVLLSITGTTNVTYRLLASSNLALSIASWTPIGTNTMDGSGMWLTTDTTGPGSRYYRVVTP